MWSDSLAWRAQFGVDAILDDFVFHEREQFCMAWPQGYHKTDKLVGGGGRSGCGSGEAQCDLRTWRAERSVGLEAQCGLGGFGVEHQG